MAPVQDEYQEKMENQFLNSIISEEIPKNSRKLSTNLGPNKHSSQTAWK